MPVPVEYICIKCQKKSTQQRKTGTKQWDKKKEIHKKKKGAKKA
jgi:hypothetical protein